MKEHGLSYTRMTDAKQRLFRELAQSGRPNTLAEHTRIAKEALRAGVEDPAKIDEQLINDLAEWLTQELAAQGVFEPTRIP